VLILAAGTLFVLAKLPSNRNELSPPNVAPPSSSKAVNPPPTKAPAKPPLKVVFDKPRRNQHVPAEGVHMKGKVKGSVGDTETLWFFIWAPGVNCHYLIEQIWSDDGTWEAESGQIGGPGGDAGKYRLEILKADAAATKEAAHRLEKAWSGGVRLDICYHKAKPSQMPDGLTKLAEQVVVRM
jgi:hypothetical protein